MSRILLVDCGAVFWRMAHGYKMTQDVWPGTTKKERRILAETAVKKFLQSLMQIRDKLGGEIAVFFDSCDGYTRTGIHDGYKAGRPRNDRLGFLKAVLHRRCFKFCRKVFKNCHRVSGLEADDLIAATAYHLQNNRKVRSIICSSDSDLLQCISESTAFFPLGGDREVTLDTLAEYLKMSYEITPTDYLSAKVIAGDPSDNIPGVDGVGIATALKYITGQAIRKALQVRISGMATEHRRLNERLIQLPWETTPTVFDPKVIKLKTWKSKDPLNSWREASSSYKISPATVFEF